MTPEQFTQWLEQKSDSGFKKPLIMGILNVTPDSFFDGGHCSSTEKACDHGLDLIAQGADIIDIGGESTRPGAPAVSINEELKRVIPVIEKIRQHANICISIDTYKSEVMEAAVSAGANVINDVYALQQAGALSMAAQLAVPVCLMHMQGSPASMQEDPQYPKGVMAELKQFFMHRIQAAKAAGIKQLILDPGFGFGKLVPHNLQLMKEIEVLHDFKYPLLLGVSRKSTIGAVLGKAVPDRLIGSISLSVFAAMKGVGMIRTHDVAETNQALQMLEAVFDAS